MKRAVIFSLAALAGLAAGGQALASDTCLSPRLVSGWTTTDQKNVILVRVAGGRHYKLELSGQCPGLNTIVELRVGAHGSGVCVSKGDYVTYRYHEFGEERCLITSVTPVEHDDQGQESQEQPSGY